MGEIFENVVGRAARDAAHEEVTSAGSRREALERLHRYTLAREFCRGYDVLDIGCGEGESSRLLAQVARSVVGTDVSAEAVARARAGEPVAGLRFEHGNALQMDLPVGGFDRVLCFDVPPGLDAQNQLAAAAARLLRPGGQLILSIPARGPVGAAPAPALTRAMIEGLLKGHFAHLRVLSQRPIQGSVLAPADGAPSGLLSFEARDAQHYEATAGLAGGAGPIVIASSAPIETAPVALFFEAGNSEASALAADETLQAALASVEQMRADVERHRRDADRERQIAHLESRRLEQARDEVERARRDADMLRAIVGRNFIAMGARAAPVSHGQAASAGADDWRYLYDRSQERCAKLEDELATAQRGLKQIMLDQESRTGASEPDSIETYRLKREIEEWRNRYFRLHGRIDGTIRKYSPRIWRKALRKRFLGPAEEG